MKRKIETLADAEALANEIRTVWPDKARAIDALVAAAHGAGKKDGLNIIVGISYKLEKFDGDLEPGKKPVEVIEGKD